MRENDSQMYQLAWESLFDVNKIWDGHPHLAWLKYIDLLLKNSGEPHRGQMVLALTFATLNERDQKILMMRTNFTGMSEGIPTFREIGLSQSRQSPNYGNTEHISTTRTQFLFYRALRNWKKKICMAEHELGELFPDFQGHRSDG